MGADWLHISFAGLCGLRLATVRSRVAIRDLPPSLEGKRLLFVSDIHLGWMFPLRALRQLLARLEAERADLLMWGGDYAEDIAGERVFFREAARLRAPLGVFGVLGNNDYEAFEGRHGEMRALFREAGVRLLVNKAARVDLADGRILIAGTDDLKYGHPTNRALPGGKRKGEVRILLSHSPLALASALRDSKEPPEMILCGHTHGGQIALGGLTPFSFGYERRLEREGERPRPIARTEFFAVTGERYVNGAYVLVSNGVGVSKLPLRLGAPAQIHVLTLTSSLTKFPPSP